MQLLIDDLAVEVSKKKITPTLMLPKFTPAKEVPKEEAKAGDEQVDGKWYRICEKVRNYYNRETGDLIGDKTKVTWRDEVLSLDNGEIVPKNEVVQLTHNQSSGKLELARLFENSKNITPKFGLVNKNELSNYAITSYYEVFINKRKYNDAEYQMMLQKMYDKAELLIAEGKVGMGVFVHRKGTTFYVIFIYPIIREVDGEMKFCWIMATTNTQLHYDNMMPVPTSAPIKEALPEPNVAKAVEAFISA